MFVEFPLDEIFDSCISCEISIGLKHANYLSKRQLYEWKQL